MKYMLFFFNFIFFIVGAAILAVGIWIKVDPTVSEYIGLTLSHGSYDIATYIFIVVGVLIFMVGFLGCCGACKESSCMLCLFATLMIVIVLLQVVAGILAVVFQSEVESELKERLSAEINSEMTLESSDPFTHAVNVLQMEFECCGAEKYTDYQEDGNIMVLTNNTRRVPKSCCVAATGDLGNPTLSDEDWEECSDAATSGGDEVKQQGCYDSLVNWAKEHALIVAGVGFGLAVIEILGIIFACCVRSKISSGEYA